MFFARTDEFGVRKRRPAFTDRALAPAGFAGAME